VIAEQVAPSLEVVKGALNSEYGMEIMLASFPKFPESPRLLLTRKTNKKKRKNPSSGVFSFEFP